ncbi:hypothetical protein GCM10009799_34510 [Nocardiopsis rhodophaea]|uniref:Uncharacterized protein n=1 Tax=Nocardiopsis rhodophaea TaxID=280238 RepID=A0ABN2TC31_9ACTN
MTTVAAARWGRTPAHADRHAQAARLQARYPQFVIWHGEHTGAWFAMTTNGLIEASTPDALTRTLRSLAAASAVSRTDRRPALSGASTGTRRLFPRPRPRVGR